MTETDDLQSKFEYLFDYLYANAPVRTPIAIWEEVQKILQTGVFIEQTLGNQTCFQLQPKRVGPACAIR